MRANLAPSPAFGRPLTDGALLAVPGTSILAALDLLLTNPKTGKRTGLAQTVRRALKALRAAGVPHCVIGATALAVRGLPRMTRDLDVVVMLDDAPRASHALLSAGFEAATPLDSRGEPESMIVFIDPKTQVDVDLLVAAGDPEATVIDQAETELVFGLKAPVAALEHLLLCYLYSNQPKHLGDFAAIVRTEHVDLARAERMLALMHPEMLATWKKRVKLAKAPPPAPKKPSLRRGPKE
jgi:hypothetical protein